ncbi:MAG TPA: RICIN domain-containing protein [Micromonosporaceae bacterium]|nr:RICIN domain-containing protein [Micromonosporaceae bacterium]
MEGPDFNAPVPAESPLRGPVQRRTVLKGAAAAAAVAGGTAWAVSNAPSALAAPMGNMYEQQRQFVEWRFGMFIHFNMATFTDEEWASAGPPTGPVRAAQFKPTALDVKGWADAAASAKMQWAALTTKHHDGFCLWPTKTTPHNVSNGTGVDKDGKRVVDVVRLYVDEFRAAGVQPCFYFSIWDKTAGIDEKGITRADIDFTKAQLTELLGGTYGVIPVLIIDGWAWKMGHHAMPYSEIRAHIKSLNPNILIIDHNGQTEMWEQDAIYFEEPKGIWCPPNNTYASCQGQNIVNSGWFWHPPNSVNGRRDTAATPTRSVADIVSHIKTLEARYCSFLLNCMPNNKGTFDAHILATLAATGRAWSPNTSRPPLPAQPDSLLYPVTPVAATASSNGSLGAPAPNPSRPSTAFNAIDGKVDWAQFARESWWQSTGSLPQSVTMDLGAVWSNIDTVTYLPRQDRAVAADPARTTGNITGYRVLTSTNGTTFTEAARGTWPSTKSLKYARFAARNARYVRLEATGTVGGGPAIINELNCGGIDARPIQGGTTPTSPVTPVPTTPGGNPTGTVKIINRNSGKALTIAADGQTVVQTTDTGAANQRFQVVDLGTGYSKLVNPATGKALDVFARSLLDGGVVSVWTDNGGNNQQWTITDLGGGYRKLVNRNSGKALDVANRSLLDNGAVIQWTDNGGNNQQWTFVAV